jgi:hypothetical protein
MASNRPGARKTAPPDDGGGAWTVVGGGKKRGKAAATVTPAPKLSGSPRASAPSGGLSARVEHTPKPKPVLEPPVRAAVVSAPKKELSTVAPHKAPSSASERTATVDTTPKPVPKPVPKAPVVRKSTAETVIERGYPLGFKSKQEFRDATRPMARLARDGTVFVSGSSVTGVSHGRKLPSGAPAPFGPTSDIDVGIASRRLRADATQVQQSGKGTAFPVSGSALDNTRGRTRERHPIGAKAFNGVPSERTVLVREHTPEGLRTKG